jgi:hypothetical protein
LRCPRFTFYLAKQDLAGDYYCRCVARDLRDIFGNRDQMTTAEILNRLHALPEAPWSDLKGKQLNDLGLAFRLREYGVKSRTLNLGGENRAKGYAHEDLHDVWHRYLAPLPPSPDASVTSVTSVTDADFQAEKVTLVTGNERSVTHDGLKKVPMNQWTERT